MVLAQLLLCQPSPQAIQQLHRLVLRPPILELPNLHSIHRKRDQILSVDSVANPEAGGALKTLLESETEDVGGFA